MPKPIRLRPLAREDAESIARHADDRDVWLNLRDRFPHPYALADAEAYVAHVLAGAKGTTLGIEVDGQVAGVVALVLGDDVERVSAEIGYWLGREHRGRGVMTEALRAATSHAFASFPLERVFALPFARNVASCRVLEKAGYVVEGRLRHSAVKDGALVDQVLYAAYRDRWPPQPVTAGR